MTEDDVKRYLEELIIKMNVFEIRFDGRNKNVQGLLDLDITREERLNYIKGLKAKDYINGPKKDKDFPKWREYYEFGKK